MSVRGFPNWIVSCVSSENERMPDMANLRTLAIAVLYLAVALLLLLFCCTVVFAVFGLIASTCTPLTLSPRWKDPCTFQTIFTFHSPISTRRWQLKLHTTRFIIGDLLCEWCSVSHSRQCWCSRNGSSPAHAELAQTCIHSNNSNNNHNSQSSTRNVHYHSGCKDYHEMDPTNNIGCQHEAKITSLQHFDAQ